MRQAKTKMKANKYRFCKGGGVAQNAIGPKSYGYLIIFIIFVKY